MPGWPYPADTPMLRARRIAQAYRARLMNSDPDGCTELDVLCVDYGETWVVPRIVTYELDDWLTPAQAADIAHVQTATVRQWRARGRLAGRHTDGGWRYRARDVLGAAAKAPRRQPKT